jgi:AraC-like DNA-binding protein
MESNLSMHFVFENRPPQSPLVDLIYRTESEGMTNESFMSQAASRWEIVFTRQIGKTWVSLRGPETKANPAPIPEDAEFLGIVFKLGTYMPHLPTLKLVDDGLNLPMAADQRLYLHGASWETPDFENVDVFIDRLVREQLLVQDEVVMATLDGQQPELSVRTLQRRFLNVTGLSQKSILQIERANEALKLLEQGIPILDVVFATGFYDQPHLTKALKHYTGQTPAQIARMVQSQGALIEMARGY